MEAHFKRVVFTDEGLRCPQPTPSGLRGFLAAVWEELLPSPAEGTYEFPNYALGFKWSASERELELIQRHGMHNHVALRLHDNFPPLTFADLLGNEWIPDVHHLQSELLQTETRVRETAVKWTFFLENLDANE